MEFGQQKPLLQILNYKGKHMKKYDIKCWYHDKVNTGQYILCQILTVIYFIRKINVYVLSAKFFLSNNKKYTLIFF